MEPPRRSSRNSPRPGDNATPPPDRPRRPPTQRGSRPTAAGPRPKISESPDFRQRRGAIGLREVGPGVFELVHPPCVFERELDYEEGIELRRDGDFEGARDALRFALDGCGDNLWVHAALGAIALDDQRDAVLARGHYGYAVELGRAAIPLGFRGRLPRDRTANRPFFEAIAGLARSLEALRDARLAAEVRGLADRLDPRS